MHMYKLEISLLVIPLVWYSSYESSRMPLEVEDGSMDGCWWDITRQSDESSR